MTFIGRNKELELLREQNWHDQAILIAIYGRRRVGKSRLVEEAYKGKNLIIFDGLEGQNRRSQLNHFFNQLQPHLLRRKIETKKKFTTWHEALDALSLLIKYDSDKELIILFDEFQWMAEMKSALVSLFKSYWDNKFIKSKHLKFIICGSVSSFIVKKVLKSKALYGRIDHEIQLGPFNTLEIKQFLAQSFPTSEVLKAAMTLGGIPEYLERLSPKLSLIQNLSALAFSPLGYFLKEYEKIFISHFGHAEIYSQIIEALSSSSLSHNELTTKISASSGGTFSGKIDDLILAGFVERYVPVDRNNSTKLVCYRLKDEYLHFYFRFIKRWQLQIQGGEVIPEQILLGRNYEQWLGYAFERICRNNSFLIADKLKFSGISYRVGSWFRRDTEFSAQIDLLFVRADKVILTCELKHSLTLDYKELSERIDRQNRALIKAFPRYALQNVLIMAEKIEIPEAIKKLFTHILFSDQVFFDH
jgi:uncharacterized protein